MKCKLLILGMLMSMTTSFAYADYLVKPAPEFVSADCPSCCPHVRHHKKHRVIKHHRRRIHRRACYARAGIPVCRYYYHPQPAIVAFVPGAPVGCGRYVNLYDCTPYDPDMSTGDDDPTIYPGMNINN
jgi:hypothetical protein